MRLSLLASQPGYFHHLAPVWRALPEEARGSVCVLSGGAEAAARRYGLEPLRGVERLEPAVLVAGGRDALMAGARAARLAHLDHGAGQTYYGDPSHPVSSYGYPGGPDLDRVSLFLTASERVAQLWRSAYPSARAVAVGPCSISSELAARGAPSPSSLGLTFHWPCQLIAESGSAWHDWRQLLEPLARQLPVLGHAHPRWGSRLWRAYEQLGIEPVAWLPELAERCGALVCDNSSVIYEFAALGRPVILLNAARWRPGVEHGLRFWSALPGPALWPAEAARLPQLAQEALESPEAWPWAAQAEEAVRLAYEGLADGQAPARAAAELEGWLRS